MSTDELHGAYMRSFQGLDSTQESGVDHFLKALLDSFSKIREDFKVSQTQHVETVQEFVAHKARMEAEITVLRAEVHTLKRQMQLEKWKRDKEMEAFGKASAVLGTIDHVSLYMSEKEEIKTDAEFVLFSSTDAATIGEVAEVKEETFSPRHYADHHISREVSVHRSTSVSTGCEDDVVSCATTENMQAHHEEDESLMQCGEGKHSQQLKPTAEMMTMEDSHSTQVPRSPEPEKRSRQHSSSEQKEAKPSDGAYVWAIYKMPNSAYDNQPYAAKLKHLASARSAWRVHWLDGDRSVRSVTHEEVVRCMAEREVVWVRQQIASGNPFVSMHECERVFRQRRAKRSRDRSAAAAPDSASASELAAGASFRVGDHVEGLYEDGEWYRGTIVAKTAGMFEVAWEDGDDADNFKTEAELRLVVEVHVEEAATAQRKGKKERRDKGAKRQRKGESADVRGFEDKGTGHAASEEWPKLGNALRVASKHDLMEEEEPQAEEEKEGEEEEEEESGAFVPAREEGPAATTEEEAPQQLEQPQPQPQPQERQAGAEEQRIPEEEMYSYDSDELSCGDPSS